VLRIFLASFGRTKTLAKANIEPMQGPMQIRQADF
jgi:hypothetical protein